MYLIVMLWKHVEIEKPPVHTWSYVFPRQTGSVNNRRNTTYDLTLFLIEADSNVLCTYVHTAGITCVGFRVLGGS